MSECPYVNKHKHCPKCGRENPKVCGLQEPEPVVEDETTTLAVEEPTRVTTVPETLTFAKPKGRPRRV